MRQILPFTSSSSSAVSENEIKENVIRIQDINNKGKYKMAAYFTICDHSKAVLVLWIFYVFFCLVFAMPL